MTQVKQETKRMMMHPSDEEIANRVGRAMIGKARITFANGHFLEVDWDIPTVHDNLELWIQPPYPEVNVGDYGAHDNGTVYALTGMNRIRTDTGKFTLRKIFTFKQQ